MIEEVPNELNNNDPLAKKVRVFFNGRERFDVTYYNIKEGYIKHRVASGYGAFRQFHERTMRGEVEVKWK